MSTPRLPPDQQLAAPGKWPIVGERAPRADDSPWTVAITGLVDRPRTWTLDELAALIGDERAIDIHCVTRWSKLGVTFAGVPLTMLLELAGVQKDARFVSFIARSERNHDTSLPLSDALSLDALVALRCAGEPIPGEHGGPVRMVVPGRYFYKSLKWLARIEILADDRLGFWERTAGYHNQADPWKSQRYMAAAMSRQEMQRAIAARDFSDRDLRSLHARGHDLPDLVARRALLRDADFRGANLGGADFGAANLSNAHFANADLRGASFAAADVEGADFTGARLEGADFRGASLVGTTFVDIASTVDAADVKSAGDTSLAPARGAALDRTTKFDIESLEALAPPQQDYVRRMLSGR